MGDFMNINYSELKKKEVVNVITGKNLGKIIDLVIDTDKGKILKIVVPGKKGFLSCENEEIDYDCIVKIGDDAILYKPCSPKKESECECFEFKPCDAEDE